MILLKPGFKDGVLNPKYILFSGVNILISSLRIDEYPVEGKVSIFVDGALLFNKMGYAQFTDDDATFVPVASYEALLALFDLLKGVYVPGVKYSKLVSAADTNETLIKAGRSKLHQVLISNTSGNPAYLKLFDTAVEPVPGTDVPFMVIDTAGVKDSVVLQPVCALKYGLGISITAVIDDSDTSSVGAGDVVITFVFE